MNGDQSYECARPNDSLCWNPGELSRMGRGPADTPLCGRIGECLVQQKFLLFRASVGEGFVWFLS